MKTTPLLLLSRRISGSLSLLVIPTLIGLSLAPQNPFVGHFSDALAIDGSLFTSQAISPKGDCYPESMTRDPAVTVFERAAEIRKVVPARTSDDTVEWLAQPWTGAAIEAISLAGPELVQADFVRRTFIKESLNARAPLPLLIDWLHYRSPNGFRIESFPTEFRQLLFNSRDHRRRPKIDRLQFASLLAAGLETVHLHEQNDATADAVSAVLKNTAYRQTLDAIVTEDAAAHEGPSTWIDLVLAARLTSKDDPYATLGRSYLSAPILTPLTEVPAARFAYSATSIEPPEDDPASRYALNLFITDPALLKKMHDAGLNASQALHIGTVLYHPVSETHWDIDLMQLWLRVGDRNQFLASLMPPGKTSALAAEAVSALWEDLQAVGPLLDLLEAAFRAVALEKGVLQLRARAGHQWFDTTEKGMHWQTIRKLNSVFMHEKYRLVHNNQDYPRPKKRQNAVDAAQGWWWLYDAPSRSPDRNSERSA